MIALGAGAYFSYRHWHGGGTPPQVSRQAGGTTAVNTPPSKPPNSGTSPGNPNATTSSSTPTSTPSAPTNSATSSNAAPGGNGAGSAATASTIRNVDFRNFSYYSDTLHKNVRVTNGEWKGATVGYTPGDLFAVSQIAYGDLKQDGKQEAVVWADAQIGGMSPNTGQSELFVYSLAKGNPVLLAHLTEKNWGEGSGAAGGLINDLQPFPGKLLIEFLARNNVTAWTDTATMQWRAGQLVRTQLLSPPTAGQGAPAAGGPRTAGASTHQVITATAKPGGCTSWGFQPANCSPKKVPNPPVTPTSVGQLRSGTTQQIAQPNNPTSRTRTTVSPPPPPPPPVASAGTVVWSGHLDKNATITIQGSSASSGTLEGQLPGVPVMIQVSPSDIAVAEFPGPQNGWKTVVLRGSKNRNVVVRIQWRTLQQ